MQPHKYTKNKKNKKIIIYIRLQNVSNQHLDQPTNKFTHFINRLKTWLWFNFP